MTTALVDMDKLHTLLTPDEWDMVLPTINRNTNYIRTTKPKAPYAQYIWRMLVFYTSDEHAHQCMPMTADWCLSGSWNERREQTKVLDLLVDKVLDCTNPKEWHGAIRWGQALGITSATTYKRV